MCAPSQALRPGLDKAVFDDDVGAHRLQPGDVEIDRPRADGAAARQGHVGLTEAGHQRAQDENRCPHGLDQFVGRLASIDVAGVDLDAQLIINRDLHAHHLQQRQHGRDVLEVRHIAIVTFSTPAGCPPESAGPRFSPRRS